MRDPRIESLIDETSGAAGDPAHDAGHVRRVLAMARRIAAEEGPHDPDVLAAAAILHDCVHVRKDSPERGKASAKSAARAEETLRRLGFQGAFLNAVGHAIEAHSFSASIRPMTPEARALRDADRLDALGAVGVARCMAYSGTMGRALAHPTDPLAKSRPLDELAWALDHFQVKLLRLADGMTTAAGRRIADGRTDYLRAFMERMAAEYAGEA